MDKVMFSKVHEFVGLMLSDLENSRIPAYNKENDYCKMEKRGKTAPPFMEKGTVIGIKNNYRIEKLVGGGGFGQIYRAIDLESKIVVAVKVEPKSSESARLVLELKILLLLNNCPHTPKVYCSGEYGEYNFIIMQMLGKNVGDIRKKQRSRSLSVLATVRIGIQVVECLRQVHSLGYIHRDVKPSNICIGIGENRRVAYVVDFGMARKIRGADGKFRPERAYASFRGTTRYVSVTAHERKEQGFVDDLWSLFYSLVELSEGLPWKNVVDQDEVCVAKRLFLKTYRVKKFSQEFELFPQILERTRRTDIPDYDKLISILKESTTIYDDSCEFEWDTTDDSIEWF
ncbi:unnamed protein product [Caenorhabditis bovis]|uniref:non-specific serine/threonine protein kinase n=1 Tax=Caenorhabditis bovis TaxID=2654633 RepID=A0A8S1ETL4_9PELO|nr:unnamed protein product [Caenorhabditis bovis]